MVLGMSEPKDITTVTVVEFKKHFGRYREAAQRAPVGITNHGRLSAVLISAAEYDELSKLKRDQPESGFVWQLPDDVVSDIAKAAEGDLPEECHEAERALAYNSDSR